MNHQSTKIQVEAQQYCPPNQAGHPDSQLFKDPKQAGGSIPQSFPNRKTRVDFSRLTWGTLRKYQSYFGVRGGDQGPQIDKRAVEEAVKQHFESFNVDQTKLVIKFLRIRKDENRIDLNYNLRKPTRARYQGNMDSIMTEEAMLKNM